MMPRYSLSLVALGTIAALAATSCGGATGPAPDPIGSSYQLASVDGATLPVKALLGTDSVNLQSSSVLIANGRSAVWELDGTRLSDGTTASTQGLLVVRQIAPDSIELSGPNDQASGLIVLYAGHYSLTSMTLDVIPSRASQTTVVLLGGMHTWRFTATP